MKYQAVLALLLISLVYAQYKCPKFKCGLASEVSLDEVCSKRVVNGGETLYQLRVCSSYMTQNCGFIFSNETSNCINNSTAPRSLLPGEPCLAPGDCMSNVCVGGYCSGNEVGYACNADAECKVGTGCVNGKCQTLVKEGGECGVGKARCLNHLACSLGTCVRLGSLAEGSPSDTPLACKSMYVAPDSTGVYACAAGPKLKGYSGKLIECNMGQMCEYSLSGDQKLSMPCKCGINGAGKSYCRPGEGDLGKEIESFLKVAATAYEPPCHVSNPWFCLRRLKENGKEYHPAYVSYKTLSTPEIYAENDLCVQWDLNKDYWVSYNIVHSHGNKNDSDGAITLNAGVSVLFAILLLELFFLI